MILKYILPVIFLFLKGAVGISLYKNHELFQTVSKSAFDEYFLQLDQETRDLLCTECKSAMSSIDTMVDLGVSEEQIMQTAINICIQFNMYTPDICDQMVHICGPEVIYILHSTNQSYSTVCDVYLGDKHCAHSELPNWTLTMPENKPEPYHPIPDPDSKRIRIMHLSDLHVDHMYLEGTEANCDHPLCCRTYSGINLTSPIVEPAGKWGSTGQCDLPIATLDLGLDVAASYKPDIVYVTGDLPPHDVWMQSRETIISSIKLAVGALKSSFPDTPVYIALGNHESNPVNSFVVPTEYTEERNMDWLYEKLAEYWSYWLPDETTNMIKSGAYYVTKALPGLKVISLNMNYCPTDNWWLFKNNYDPASELQWLIGQLIQAEIDGDKVHIIGHIPPSSCEYSWSHTFNKIISRYENTISGLFFGHSHRDQWLVHFDTEDNTRPVAVSYIGPSMTTYGGHNPAFRIYEVDGGYEGATYAVTETETYVANLTIANESGEEPIYNLSYKGSEAFKLDAFTPDYWANMTWDMATDDELFHNFLRAYHRLYAEPPEIDNCQADCRKSHLCHMYKADSTDREPCERIQNAVDSS